MDPFSWILLCWLAIAGVAYLALQKAIEKWPLSETRFKKPVEPAVSAPTSPNSGLTATLSSALGYASNSSDVPQWVNEFLSWLFHNYRGVPEWIHVWLRSLNDAAKKIATPGRCEVLFEELIDRGTQPPKLTNVRAEQGPRDQMTLRALMHIAEIKVRLVSSQRMPDRLLVTNYDATISDLTGEVQLRVACIANELFLMGCFNGRPEMSIDLVNTDSNSIGGQVEPTVVDEAIRKSLVSAVTNFTLGATQSSSANGQVASGLSQSYKLAQPVEEVFKRLNVQTAQRTPGVMDREMATQLLVKVIRAQKLGKGEVVSRPFVSVELDEPSQKHLTTKGLNISPYWEEEFVFDINSASEEILFEVIDQETDTDPPKFYGLAIIGLEELRTSTNTLHTLTLQSRPYQNDPVSGTLQVEFLFLHESRPTEIGKTVIVRQEEAHEGLLTETVAAARRPLSVDNNYPADVAVPIVTKTTTVMVKSVSQYFQTPETSDLPEQLGGQYYEGEDETTPRADPPTVRLADEQQNEQGQVLIVNRTQPQPSPPLIQVNAQPAAQYDRPSRPEKRGFFGQLRRKLSFSRSRRKKRPHSFDDGSAIRNDGHVGVASQSQPTSRDVSETRYSTSMRSYVDAASADVSVVSSTTIYQRSTLVVEIERNEVKKYYLIPPNMIDNAQAQKLMRRGKKLHIFNEHIFVAVRIRGGTKCHICGRSVNRSFAKQAYQCRDCEMLCHKTCHYKTDTFCSRSTVSNLEIEYVWTDTI